METGFGEAQMLLHKGSGKVRVPLRQEKNGKDCREYQRPI